MGSVDKAAPDRSALITIARPSAASSADGIESGSKHPVEQIGAGRAGSECFVPWPVFNNTARRRRSAETKGAVNVTRRSVSVTAAVGRR